MDQVILRTEDGIPFLAPEIQLLYKAKHARAKDEQDFSLASEAMDPPQRAWLARALAMAHPQHPWTRRLA